MEQIFMIGLAVIAAVGGIVALIILTNRLGKKAENDWKILVDGPFRRADVTKGYPFFFTYTLVSFTDDTPTAALPGVHHLKYTRGARVKILKNGNNHLKFVRVGINGSEKDR